MVEAAVETFATWSGWTPVAAIAQLLSLVTIGAGVWRYAVNRRRAPLVQLVWDLVGSVSINGAPFHLVEVTNVGRGAAAIKFMSLVGGRADPNLAGPVPRHLGSGESHRIAVTAEKIEKVWVLLMYGNHEDFRATTFRWAPLVESGSLHEQYLRERERWWERSWWARWRDSRGAQLVGPGGVPRVDYRRTPRCEFDDRVKIPKATYYPVIAYTDGNVREIPVVDLELNK